LIYYTNYTEAARRRPQRVYYYPQGCTISQQQLLLPRGQASDLRVNGALQLATPRLTATSVISINGN